ncbi:hypothetical protein [Trichormus variabilis]|uniref:hypothetical protein n=1 Tax=Anabaena variabilis TaxID=264691 RepID=UPI0016247FD2|nr:hypothetical protein [Trichormus variabilis]MBC1326695.1 hypothetical protein [Trichormus variabilis 9RC]
MPYKQVIVPMFGQLQDSIREHSQAVQVSKPSLVSALSSGERPAISSSSVLGAA